MKVLLTHALEYLGRAIARALQASEHQVIELAPSLRENLTNGSYHRFAIAA